ncbi:MAG: radical SAM protein, partial [Chloroflexi bacterium]|nr:radical SAM protein [Chloroflexota bacterium]
MHLDFFVQLHVTQRCNLRCRHCYQAGACEEMSAGEVFRAIDNVHGALEGWASDHDVETSPSLHLTGGEPLLRQDLFDIVAYARDKGFSVSMMSNGVLVDPAIALRIREAGIEDVQVSMEGLERTHDEIRGRGSFRRALAGIWRLKEAGVEANINVTVSRLNRGQVAGLIRTAAELGAGGIAFSRLVPAG